MKDSEWETLERKLAESEEICGGLADGKTAADIAEHHECPVEEIKTALTKGMDVEREHTDDKSKAKEIALDHLWEDKDYYNKLESIEH